MEPVSFGVVGVGGYASVHISSVEAFERGGLGRLSAVVIRNRDKHADAAARLEKRGVTIHPSYEGMLKEEAGGVEIIALPTAIHQHRDMTIRALEAGFSVLVEKPPAVTIQDIDEMMEVEEGSAGFCAVGFQSQSKGVVRTLKERICDGRLGRIGEIVVKGRYKRLDSYYQRNAWAGKFIHEGEYVLDGTVCNPLSHHLLNALYFASTERKQAANPVKVRAELYKGHDISGEDTSCLEVEVENGTRVLFFATLCGPENERPVYEVAGSRGVIRWRFGEDARIDYKDGEVEAVVDDGSDERVEVFRNAARYLRGVDEELNCPLSLARPFVLALNGAYESARTIRKIQSRHLRFGREGDSVSTTIENIEEIIDEAFKRRRLFSDLGVEWASPTNIFILENYGAFNMRV